MTSGPVRVEKLRIAAALDALRGARQTAEVAGDALRTAIVQAVDAGATYADAGEAAHLSKQRIGQIITEEKKGASRGNAG